MPVLLPTAKVLKLCHPLRSSPWDAGPITKRMVQEHLRNQWFCPSPVDHGATAEQHAGRIAFLVNSGWRDAIEIDVGIPSMGCHVAWPVLDGNHRLAAASLRRDEQILAFVAGDLDYALDLFGIECEEPQDCQGKEAA
jgi:hypothetical protein